MSLSSTEVFLLLVLIGVPAAATYAFVALVRRLGA